MKLPGKVVAFAVVVALALAVVSAGEEERYCSPHILIIPREQPVAMASEVLMLVSPSLSR